jgi:NAD+ diphosphatase
MRNEHPAAIVLAMAIDRAAERRTDAFWLEAAARAPRAQAVLAARGRIGVVDGAGPPRLARVPLADVGRFAAHPVFLGLEGGVPLFAAAADGAAVPGVRLAELRRTVLALEDPGELEVAAYAAGILQWHATHGHCANCGAATRAEDGGHVRVCPACGTRHFPRTDPVVQVLVHDGERLLLGRSPGWPERMWSVLAGFVEPGETLAQAAAREVLEETGLVVDGLAPAGDQPWPNPHQLLVAFAGTTADVRRFRLTEELEAIRVLTRPELRAALAAGELVVPPPRSQAGVMIGAWLDGG